MTYKGDKSQASKLEKMGLNVQHFPALTDVSTHETVDACFDKLKNNEDKIECLVEKELLLHTIENLNDIYLVIDRKRLKLLRWNPIAESITGFHGQLTLEQLFNSDSILQISSLFLSNDSTTSKQLTLHVNGIKGKRVPFLFNFSYTKVSGEYAYITAIGRDISSDVESHKKLVESRNKYESIFNSTDDGIIIFDPILGITDCNKAALDLFQYNSKEEFLNTTFLEISSEIQVCNESPSLLFKQHLEDIILFGSKIFKWSFVKLNNHTFPANVAITKFVYEGKTLFNARISDISHEQKRLELLFMERNLSISLQSESTTKAILAEAVDHLMILSDIDAGIAIQWLPNSTLEIVSAIDLSSELYLHMSGYSYTQLAIEYFLDGECHFFNSQELQEIYGFRSCEFKASIWIPQLYNDNLTGLIVLFSKDDQILSSEMKSAIDIVTGIVHNAVTRSSAEEELRSSEERHRNLVESAPYGIFVSNFDKEITDVNSAACQVTGDSRESLLNTNLIDFISGEKQDSFKSNMEKLFLTGVFYDEYPIILKSGKKTVWSINTVRTSDTRALSFVMDISKTRELEQRINQKEKLEAIGQLAGGIAHDFNNQLTGIIGYSELLKESLTNDPELTEFVDYILTATKRSSEITAQLLAYARKGKYTSKAINVHSILDEVTDLLKHTLDRRIIISTDFTETNLQIQGDATQLQNMFLNLAINARDAMPEGGELSFSTTIVADNKIQSNNEFQPKPGNYVQITVSDTGTGIDEETQKKIFEPFFTTKEKGKGTGMGLAAAYGTVKNHKGYIEIESELNKGTSFLIYLPEIDKEAEQNLTVDIVDKADVKLYGQGSILVVDDDELICDTLSKGLGKLGYRTNVTYNGLDAVDFYRTNWMNIDLVILDMVMPLLNGKDTFFELKKINRNVKVVISSGFTSDTDVQLLLQEGAKKFVQKPYNISTVSSVVYDIINA